MLTILADAFVRSKGPKDWDAPDHWTSGNPRRGPSNHEREAAYWRRRAHRDVGLW
ncbi:hypothetical protein [Yoonia sp. BS5-3]|uniref:Uncharacterized protein n=1 Tax=Yoonia phaeophyticola TaxID=3137369 RepID=A0ABZ2V4B1_9RHOB